MSHEIRTPINTILGMDDIKEKDPIEIYVDGSSIILKKFEPNCIFCGNTKKLIQFKDKLVCTKCSERLAEELKAENLK